MASALLPTREVAGPCITVRASGPGVDLQRSLPAEDAIVIGASPACGIRLQGDGIAAMHCTISFEQGQLVIEDWDTGAGTYIDGKRIAREVTVPPGTSFTIGDYTVCTSLDGAKSPSLVAAPTVTAVVPPPVDVEKTVEVDPPRVGPPAPPRNQYAPAADTSADNDDAYDDVWDTPADTEGGRFNTTPSVSSYAPVEGVTDDDTLELLRIEVEFLRAELAERDAHVSGLERRSDDAGSGDEDLPDREEVEALVGRLEDLLAELDHSDERLKTMTELLRTSEDANAASEEERTQMEAWIGEVERRVRQWESEWHAEKDTLTKRVTELTAERDAAESHGGSRESVEIIQTLRHEITRLEQESAERLKERDTALQRIEEADVDSIEQRVAAAVESAMREERLQVSQAKAECARERAKLAQVQEELASQKSVSVSEPDIADVRIRAFREHLKEIRASEPDSRPAAPSMSQRMGKLWRKIEGRPLDTD